MGGSSSTSRALWCPNPPSQDRAAVVRSPRWTSPYPYGTVKRPDISVWCEWPKVLEGFVHEVPEAVIEIVSPGYEAKDLVRGPPVYLRNGVKDVIVLDRAKGEIHHWGPQDHRVGPSTTVFELRCGSE